MEKKILREKTIIVTGTARGIGKKMVETFASFGADVVACARTETPAHREYCGQMADSHKVRIIPLYFELTDADQLKNAVKKIRGMGLAVDGLVNNAGITSNALFQMTGMDEARRQMEVNFFGPFLFTQYISKLMVRNQKGSIVNIASTAALDGNSGKAAYGASKAALLTMTLCVSGELAAGGIRANVICPGITETDMADTLPEDIRRTQKEYSFLKKTAAPEDIAKTAAFLLSDASSYITGQVIRVDGGMSGYAKRQ